MVTSSWVGFAPTAVVTAGVPGVRVAVVRATVDGGRGGRVEVVGKARHAGGGGGVGDVLDARDLEVPTGRRRPRWPHSGSTIVAVRTATRMAAYP